MNNNTEELKNYFEGLESACNEFLEIISITADANNMIPKSRANAFLLSLKGIIQQGKADFTE